MNFQPWKCKKKISERARAQKKQLKVFTLILTNTCVSLGWRHLKFKFYIKTTRVSHRIFTKTLPIVLKLSHCDYFSLSRSLARRWWCYAKRILLWPFVWGLAEHGLKYLINMYNIIILRLYAFMNIDGLLVSIKMEKERKKNIKEKIIFIYDINVVFVVRLLLLSYLILSDSCNERRAEVMVLRTLTFYFMI